ncbi:MAG TPA: phosphotransferase [Rhodanobacteraceae bacterium]|nr:phosphotransferase [Rhodanobacteraceae bacterium]
MTVTDHRSHGLAGDETAPDWPPLETAEVRALLDNFPRLRGPVTIRWRSPRPLSAAARVDTVAGEIFVKRHHANVRTPDTLSEEHAFIVHLRTHGVPMPEVLADAEGRTAIARGEWTYEVHAIADGIDLYRDTISWAPLTDVEQARTAGRMLARLHRASASFDAPQRDTWILVSRDDCLRAPDLLAAIDAQCRQRPALADYLRQRDWRQELASLAARHHVVQPRLAELPRLWTHNDWHVSNLCWTSAASDAAISAVLDVGLAAPTFALYDLATAIERNAIAWMQLERGMQAVFPDTARALIDGYADVLPLASDQRQLLADLLPVVHIDFALSEIEYFHGVTGSTAHAGVAYDIFLRGHAAWFDTAPGQAMLKAIRSGS